MDPGAALSQKEEILELEMNVEGWVKELLVDWYKTTEAFVSGLWIRSGACRS